MTSANKLLRNAPLIGITCGVIGIVVHVSARGRAYVIAGTRPMDLLLEVVLVSLAVTGAILIESAFARVLVFAAGISFLLEELATPAAPTGEVFALGLVVTGLAWGLLVVALFAHSGRRTAWIWLVPLTVGTIASGPLAAAAWKPDRHGCADCPNNALALLDSLPWSDGFARWAQSRCSWQSRWRSDRW